MTAFMSLTAHPAIVFLAVPAEGVPYRYSHVSPLKRYQCPPGSD